MCLLINLIVFFACLILSYSRLPSTYSDYYARHKLFPIYQTSKIENNTMSTFLNTCFFNATFIKHVDVPCDEFKPNNTNIACAGTLFVSHDDEAIILAFRGTVGNAELNEELDDYNITTTFPGGGTVHKFYYNGLMTMWTSGLRDAFFTAKNTYSTYELWVIGGSMGGALAGMTAPYISQMGYMAAKDVKLFTFGELRIGHMDFVQRYDSLVSWAYRVVHRNDFVPHAIPLDAGYRHHKNEIWYNNTMAEGDPYIECDAVESSNCSDSVSENLWTWDDHNTYFGVKNWDEWNCTKFIQPPS